MKTPPFNPGGLLRPASLDRSRGDASKRPGAPAAQPRVDPLPFKTMRVRRLVPDRQDRHMVIDMEPSGDAARASEPISHADEALIRASKARLAARVQRLREVVVSLRLDIEILRR